MRLTEEEIVEQKYLMLLSNFALSHPEAAQADARCREVERDSPR